MNRAVAGVVLLAFVSSAATMAAGAPVKRAAHPAHAARKAAPHPARPATLPDTPQVTQLRAAFQYAFPVYEMMRTRAGTVAKAQAFGLSGVNRLFARKTLADATTREVTTPNNDTLYASAWLDLKNGPVTLTVPDLPGRYNSAALMNIFTDNVAVVGTRTGGTGRFTIAGPGFTGRAPEGTTLLRSDTNDAWLLVRVYVAGPEDIAAAGEAIDGFKLEGGGEAVPATIAPTPTPDAKTFLAVVGEALARSGVTPRVEGLAPYAELPAETQNLCATAIPIFRNELKAGFAKVGTVADGWSYPGPGIGNFGDDDAGRAAVAVGGLGALPRQEAVYLSANTDADGKPLTGASAYTVHIPPRPPVGAFWSLTMYQIDKDGRLFFVPNPLDRFAVRSAAKSLHYERDGGLDIFVQAARPSGERVVNWLPAPPGPFRLVWRAYLPRVELLDGTFRLPPVTASEVVP
ncbi:DUF1254 domain-containing protein [Sphingosinicellaceae bacterium]|nr:DUF1254 domain-containing protein [Sphingosinicellaceae bacterium]